MKHSINNNKQTDISDELKQKKKVRNALLIKLSAMLAVTAIIFIFSSIAWFTMNREVSGNGMDMKSSDLPFELKTDGSAGYSDSYLPTSENGYSFLPNTEITGTLITTGNEQKIEWLVTDTFNAKNYSNGESTEELGIRPGSYGILRFWIVPKSQETMIFRYHMQITPYKKQYPNKENGDPNYEADPTAVCLTESDADKLLAGYVDSHILFFRYKGDNPNDEENDKYSMLIDDSITEEITFEKDSEGNLKPYEVKIYWIWPETLGEAVLKDSDKRTAVCATSADGKNELLTKFNTNPSGFLNGYSFPSDTTSLTQEEIANNYPVFSIRYNNADQEIGDNIMYLLAEMTVNLY
ncbi:MAG: hypothetical protein ACI4JN_00475 [Ruminococcus sp.]